jgi:hypothetical protein
VKREVSWMPHAPVGAINGIKKNKKNEANEPVCVLN